MVDRTSALAGVTVQFLSSLFEAFTRPAVVDENGSTGHGMRKMERHGIGCRPQPRRRTDQRIRPQRVLGIQLRGHRDEIDGRLRPAFGEAAMPEREVAQRLYFPNAV